MCLKTFLDADCFMSLGRPSHISGHLHNYEASRDGFGMVLLGVNICNRARIIVHESAYLCVVYVT